MATPIERRQNAKQERRLIVASLVTSLLALAAIGLVIYLGIIHANDLTTARYEACRLFRGLVLAATPASKTHAAQVYITHTPLHDCHHYAIIGAR